MPIDTHGHVVGGGDEIERADEDVYLGSRGGRHRFTRLLSGPVETELERRGAQQTGGSFTTSPATSS